MVWLGLQAWVACSFVMPYPQENWSSTVHTGQETKMIHSPLWVFRPESFIIFVFYNQQYECIVECSITFRNYHEISQKNKLREVKLTYFWKKKSVLFFFSIHLIVTKYGNRAMNHEPLFSLQLSCYVKKSKDGLNL